jgi:hypothetical protein
MLDIVVDSVDSFDIGRGLHLLLRCLQVAFFMLPPIEARVKRDWGE